MKKTILTALIAATALAPFSAVAQEWQGRRGNRAGGQAQGQQDSRPTPRTFDREAFRAQRQVDDGANREAFRAQRQADGGANREAFRAQREAARAQRTDTGQTVDRDAFRAQRDAARAQRQAERPVQPGTQFPQQQQQQRTWSSDRRQDFRQERRDDRRDFRQERREDRRDVATGRVTPEQYRADRRDDRRDYRADRRDDRQAYRQDGRRDGWNGGSSWNRGGNWDRGGSWNRGGESNRWNRDWRSDRRYNWQDWRGRNRNVYRLPRYYAPRGYGYGYQRFGIGFTLGSILFSQNYWINDPWQYRLPPAYGPYRWVRYYNDALLVDIDSGEVVDVIYDIFW